MSTAVGMARRRLGVVVRASVLAAAACLAATPAACASALALPAAVVKSHASAVWVGRPSAKGDRLGKASAGAPGIRAARVKTAGVVKAGATTASASRMRAAKPSTARASDRVARARAAMEDDDLSFSDEFDRAELLEEMLKECRGVAYNAYELALNSGEALWMPATTQLLVVKVDHPYCAKLLRTYAPRTSV